MFVPISSLASSASGIAIAHDLSSIMFRSDLERVPFVMHGFMVFSCFISAIVTVPQSLSKNPLIFSPRLQIIDATSPLHCLASIDGIAFSNWHVSTRDLKFVVAIHCSAVCWIIA